MAVLARKRAEAIEIPNLEQDPVYAKAVGRLRELLARGSVLEARRSELAEGMSRALAADLLTRRAERLIVDDVVPLPTEAERLAMNRDLASVEDEQRVVRRAIELQAKVEQQERLRASREIGTPLVAVWRARGRRRAELLRELAALNDQERGFFGAMDGAGILWGAVDMQPAVMLFLDRFDAENLETDPSNVAMWLREARDLGLLDT